MMRIVRKIAGWSGVENTTLIVVMSFNLCLLLAAAILNDPIPFFVIIGILLLASVYLLEVKNYVEILLLVVLVFSIELLYNNLGLWALLAGFTAVLVAAWLRTLAEGGREWRDSTFTKSILLFIAVAFLSLLWGTKVFGGYRLFSINLLLGFAMYYVTHFTLSSFKSLKYLTVFLIAVLVLNAGYAIMLHLQSGARASSMFVDTPTYSGHYFVQGLALTAGAYLSPPFRKLRVSLMIGSVLLLVALFLTVTRAAWLAFVFLVFLSFFFAGLPKKTIIYGLLGVTSIVGAAFLVLSSQQLSTMLQARITLDIQSASVSVGSIAFRVLLWQSAWTLFLTRPLLGIGFDNFLALNEQTPNYAFIQALGGTGLYVHNIYLQILTEMGIVGLLVFAILLVTIYKRIAKTLKAMTDHPYRFVFLGYSGVLTLWLFMGITEASIYTPVTAAFFFFVLGIISGTHKLLQRQTI